MRTAGITNPDTPIPILSLQEQEIRTRSIIEGLNDDKIPNLSSNRSFPARVCEVGGGQLRTSRFVIPSKLAS